MAGPVRFRETRKRGGVNPPLTHAPPSHIKVPVP